MSHQNPFYTNTTVKTNSFNISKYPEVRYAQFDSEYLKLAPLNAIDQLTVIHPLPVEILPPARMGEAPRPIPVPKRKKIIYHLQMVAAATFFHPRLVFDGKAIAFAPESLKSKISPAGKRFFVHLDSKTLVPEGTSGSYTVIVKPTVGDIIDIRNVNDLVQQGRSTTGAITAINLVQMIVRQGPDQSSAQNARAFFFDQGKRPLPGGLEVWRGVVHSVRPARQRLLLTIDTAAAAVYKPGPLIGLLAECLNVHSGDMRRLRLSENDPNLKKAEKFLKKLLITVQAGTTRSSKTKTIHGLVARGGKFAFEKDGRETTVQEHFSQVYNQQIDPDLPGVWLTPKRSTKPSVVPLQLCQVVPGQLFRQRLAPEAVAAMIQHTTMKPTDRMKKIMDAAKDFHGSMYVKEARMEIESRPMTIPAKILAPARLLFGRNSVTPEKGAWNVMHKAFHTPVPLESWIFVNFCGGMLSPAEGDHIVRELMNCCGSLGMKPNPPLKKVSANPQAAIQDLRNLISTMEAQRGSLPPHVKRQLIFVIVLPQEAAHLRNAIKHWGDCEDGFMTQCMRINKCRGAKNQYFNNIALKINARLGGVNFHSIEKDKLLEPLYDGRPTMIMGADVGHPGPGVLKPSVTSLVYSTDPGFSRYQALTGVQSPRAEIIEDLGRFVFTAASNFARAHNRVPGRIIFFRDGVSEGEFDKVKDKEVKAIQLAMRKIMTERQVDPKLQVQITFVVVGKRHHALFFPDDARDGDKTGNLIPGIAVDSEITHPTERNFYLQSHAAIQGTSRSGHYTVLHDDFFHHNLDPLQRLAYLLCHNYAKATRIVSIPAPVYYADLVCSRGVFHFDPNQALSLDDDAVSISSSGSSAPRFDLDAWKNAFKPINPTLESAMYFL